MTDRAPQTEDKYIVRFPDGMRDRLKAIAAKNGRSLNAEIIHRLQETLEPSTLTKQEIAILRAIRETNALNDLP